jgi:hypothetical protein
MRPAVTSSARSQTFAEQLRCQAGMNASDYRPQQCYNEPMDADFNMKSYRERWEAIDEVERYLLDDLGRKKYSLMERVLICSGVLQDKAVEHMQIMLRWARLKELYEQGQLKQTK